MTAAANSGDDRAMNERSLATKPFLLSRRRMLVLGGGLAAGAIAGLSPRQAAAVLRLDVTQGSVQPLPIALPDFVGAGLRDPAAARNMTQIITVESATLRAVRADRSGRLSRKNIEHRHGPVSRLAHDQRPGAGDRPPGPVRRQADRAVPPMGRVRGAAARRQAVQHHAGQLAAHRAHHLRCDLRADHRREGLLRQPRGVRRRNRDRRTAASNALR